jgi:CheY-like chemotaxis protein
MVRILLVDDDVDVVEALADVLEELGHVVRTAKDGPSALRIAETLCPEVAIVDIGLPIMDGYELARRLRASSSASPGLRVIALSGYARNEERERTAKVSFDLHLRKPPSLDVLAEVVGGHAP